MRAYHRAGFFFTLTLLLAVVTTNAYAAKFSFDPSTGESLSNIDYRLPAVLISTTSIVGALLIINERKKANGVWFSNSGRLK